MNDGNNEILLLKEFNNILEREKIIDLNYPTGTFVWLPYGCKIVDLNMNFLNKLFDKYGYEKYIFPFLVSSKEFDNINKKINNFEKNIYKVNNSLILRPSGESAIYPMLRRRVKSYTDLPIRVFQIGIMFRNGTSRGFLRPNENDVFIEAHSAFESKNDAENEIKKINSLVEEYFKRLGIPTLKTIRPPRTNKPVAEKEYAFDALLPTGETALLNVTYLQMQIFSKAFSILFSKKDKTKDYTYQTEFGFSQRAILTSIRLLSKKNNVFLLPNHAPIQIVIIQINLDNKKISNYTKKIFDKLIKNKFRVKIDQEGKNLYKRFSKHENKGIPLRIEIGEKELLNSSIKIVRHDNKETHLYNYKDTINGVSLMLKKIETYSYKQNNNSLKEKIIIIKDINEIAKVIKIGKIAKIHLCYNKNCVEKTQETVKIGEIIGFEEKESKLKHSCINCGKTTGYIAFYARRV
ncbi:MAG: His/Gly/Thr/Pro-type tRNA ligase C-terminal domain-containing protein [Candidatus Absconditabacteria bacterium]|nr:His/Gly/Thr/Pro-type tRNA ligase C-terminal domain-containing protein [Candidatus Absconditabacteria bacterium]